MRSTALSRAALVATLLSGLALGAPPAPDRRTLVTANAPKRRATDWLGRPIKVPRVPFSSARQHARAARLHMVTMPNGHTVMQMLPGARRREQLAARRVA